ncbi:MAG: hypothetical protein ACI4S4_05230 [Candidatus Ornithospirochaeta sp.]
MLDKLFKISMYVLGALLLLLIVLTAAVGADEMVLRTIGWITVVPLLSALVSFILIRTRK